MIGHRKEPRYCECCECVTAHLITTVNGIETEVCTECGGTVSGRERAERRQGHRHEHAERDPGL